MIFFIFNSTFGWTTDMPLLLWLRQLCEVWLPFLAVLRVGSEFDLIEYLDKALESVFLYLEQVFSVKAIAWRLFVFVGLFLQE